MKRQSQYSHEKTIKNTHIQSKHRRWFTAALVLLFLVTISYQIWLLWPTLVLKSISWQREVNALLADLLYDAKTNPLVAGLYLAGSSFLYGMLHSLGPGHGKVIVTTYLATHPTKVKTSLILTVVSALCQALVAIALVSVLVWGFGASMQAVNLKAMYFVSLSFALVGVLGALICWKAIKQIYRSTRQVKVQVTALAPLSDASATISRPFIMQPPLNTLNSSHSSMSSNASTSKSASTSNDSPASNNTTSLNQKNHGDTADHKHTHHDECGCGHKHVVDAEAINQASTWREYIGIVATIGVRPCTGAIMVLLFANMVGLYWMGVISAIVMAAGTALTTSIIAIMTLTGKHLVKRYLVSENARNSNNGRKNKGWKLTAYSVQFLAGLFLIALGLLLIGSQDYGMSPMFSV